MTIPDIGHLTAEQTMQLAQRCFAELTPADCIAVILAQYPQRDLDRLIEELQTEVDIRDGPDRG